MTTMTPRAARDEGMALVAVILLLMMVSTLGAALTISANTETMIARNSQTAAEARAAAEAGLTHALQITVAQLLDWKSNGFMSASEAMTDLLAGPDGMTGTVATNADNGSLETWGVPRPPATLTVAGDPLVSYEARLYDEDDPDRGLTLSANDRARIGEDGSVTTDANTRILIVATGYASGGARARVEATLEPLTMPAIVTDGSLTISGNPDIQGSEGSVHSNTNLTITGNVDIAEDATASGGYSVSGTPTIGGQTGGGFPSVEIPTVEANDYLAEANFILRSDGQMTTVATGVTAACNPCAGAWAFNAGTWTITGNTAPTAATYFVQGSVSISGNMGSPGSPAQMSIVAEGSIQISGNPDMTPFSPEVMWVTEGDLKITGNVDSGYIEGLVLVREQMEIAGNVEFAGQLIAADDANLSNLVNANVISGNPTISYNGIAGIISFRVGAWRRVS